MGVQQAQPSGPNARKRKKNTNNSLAGTHKDCPFRGLCRKEIIMKRKAKETVKPPRNSFKIKKEPIKRGGKKAVAYKIRVGLACEKSTSLGKEKVRRPKKSSPRQKNGDKDLPNPAQGGSVRAKRNSGNLPAKGEAGADGWGGGFVSGLLGLISARRWGGWSPPGLKIGNQERPRCFLGGGARRISRNGGHGTACSKNRDHS